MIFLEDETLYSSTEACLDWLRHLPAARSIDRPAARERCHLYWYGDFHRKHAFAVKSFLATQDLDRTELWLWLDGESGYDGHEENRLLEPFLRHVHVRRFDPEVEAAGTPVERRPDLYTGISPTQRSDLFRFVVLFNHGGIYADLDTMFLRDVHELPPSAEEFCYRWSGHVPFANSAFSRLEQGSETAHGLLVRCAERGSCLPRDVLRFDAGAELPLLVLPCAVFDPLWLHHDRLDRYRGAPFARFDGFFRPFTWRFGRKRHVRSFRDFFPGAFAYHWHNLWGAPEHEASYFGLFDREYDVILEERLGIAAADPVSRVGAQG